MNSAQIREAFLAYFEKQGHSRVTSSSLVPGNDPTLLFTNAGMVQFKDVFLGTDARDYSRATSSQRCVRAGGKHNDLENVGYTARHHTFFEMLGNFSFGDYFKREAIRFAWEFLTKELNLPEEKLWVTVHVSDDEAADIWFNEVGISKERFSRLDEDNFWQMGDTGPCGPSSEIFYDHGEDVAGDPPGGPNDDGDRYIEIWNLVFMQFERSANGDLTPLPNPSIDTGMGLERIAAVMQGVHNNYDIDLFQHLIKSASELTECKDLSNQSLRVIADHIRSTAFMITDGVTPSNEGRGYVLRRIMRRAIRHGNKLGAVQHFFHQLAPALANVMGEAYPELKERLEIIEQTILAEEKQFERTLEHGMSILNEAIGSLEGKVIPGDVVFKLYDTYGFPVDLTNDIARERELSIDEPGFKAAMEEQRERSKEAGKFGVDYTQAVRVDSATEFQGYEHLSHNGTITALVSGGDSVETLAAGDGEVVVVLDNTPFYAESGGQTGDAGVIRTASAEFQVTDTVKAGAAFLHKGVLVSGSLAVNDAVSAEVDQARRQAIALNHSATHLLHAALREVLGEHVQQKGSLVEADKLRFDFSHGQAVTEAELEQIQALVNQEIRANHAIDTDVTSMENAKEKGAMALFGEKYGDSVRVLSMGEFSVELCGGTHAERTGDIGQLLITSEGGVASGVRRIEAVSGELAAKHVQLLQSEARAIQQLLKAQSDNTLARLQALLETQKQSEKEIDRLKAALATSSGKDLTASAQDLGPLKLLTARIDGADGKALRTSLDQLKDKLGAAAIVLVGVDGDKVAMVAGVTKAETKLVKAGDLLKTVAAVTGGKGGGRPDMAQGGGGDVNKLEEAFAKVTALVTNAVG